MFLMQLEVAQRVVSGPGSRDYGYLSVWTQLICEVEMICKVPAAAFLPPPKVDSAAVRFVRRAEERPESKWADEAGEPKFCAEEKDAAE